MSGDLVCESSDNEYNLTTIDILRKEYVNCGHYMRRKDASVKKPSPLFSASDILKLAVKEIDALNNRLSALGVSCAGSMNKEFA